MTNESISATRPNPAEGRPHFRVRKTFSDGFEQNEVTLCGTIEEDAVVYEHAFGKELLSFTLLVQRLSGVLDRVPVCIPFRVASLCQLSLHKGETLMVSGQIRTSFDEDGHLKTEVFPTVAAHTSGASSINTVRITGEISKAPVYNITPFGREITTAMLCVPYSDERYRGVAQIPVIFWGRQARQMEQYKPNEIISVFGRFQSREYEKVIDEGAVEYKTAFEISTMRFSPIERRLINNRGIF